MFYFDEDHEDNGFEVASNRTNSTAAKSAPLGLIHNTYCTSTTAKDHQQQQQPLGFQAAFSGITSPKQPSLFGSAVEAVATAAADWRKEEKLPSAFCAKTFEEQQPSHQQQQQRRSFYLGGDEEEEDSEVEQHQQQENEEEDQEEDEDSDFEDEIESLIDRSSDDEEQQLFPLDDDSGIGTISTEPSLEEEMCDRPSELISLPRSIRIGSVGRRGIMRTPRGRKQRLQFTDFYELTEDHLGQGAYASVRTCVQKSTKKEFAVKLVNKHEPGHTRSKIMREVEIFKMCKGHPNIVQLIQWFEDEDYYYMVFEKMRGGPLLNHIQAKSCFTEEEASQVTKDIAMALKFLHDKGVAHRDIKPENILCTDPDRVSPVKICDLDLASKPPSLSSRYSKYRSIDCQGSENAVSRSLPVVHSEPDLASPVGSAEFMAPEVVEAFTGDRFKYDKKCDLWALGVVIYVMLCGYPPFYGQCDNEDCKWAQGEACEDCQQNLFERIQIGEFDFPEDEGWADISEDAKDLIRHLLVKDVRERYTTDAVLKHPWVVHEAPQTPLQTVTNLLYRNDSARDITMMNENFNAINRMKAAERLANNPTIDEGDSSSTGSPPSPTGLFPGDFKQPTIPQYVPIHTPATIVQSQSPYNGYYHHHHASQPQLINMNGMMIYAPQMAASEYHPLAAYAAPHRQEIRNGTTYFYQHPQQPAQAQAQQQPWYSPPLPHNPPQQQQQQMQQQQPRSLDQINGAFSTMGLETCQNAMNRQDSHNEISLIHSKQTRETQVNV